MILSLTGCCAAVTSVLYVVNAYYAREAVARAIWIVGITLCIVVIQLQTVIVLLSRPPQEVRITVSATPESGLISKGGLQDGNHD